MAEPLDDELIAWRKFERNPVLTIAAHGDRRPHDWRDPFLFEENGKTYMVLGGNSTGRRSSGGGMVYLYVATSPDLTDWKFLGPVFEYRNREIINIECPNLFKLGSKWVLLMSPQKPCEYFIGSLDIARVRFQPESHGVLDPGTAYASNISVDGAGRTLLWLWGRTETNPDKGWNSTMVLPRVLTIGDDGFLRQNPAPEFDQLRGEVRRHAPADLHPSRPLSLSETITGDSVEIDATFSVGTATRVGLRVRSAGTEQSFPVFYGAHPANFPPDAGFSLGAGTAATLIGKDRRIRIRVFLDKGVIEAYANDGSAAIFTHLDPSLNYTGRMEAYVEGGSARLESLAAWPLNSARFSLEHYQP
jgi:beta-fructofuranosidase